MNLYKFNNIFQLIGIILNITIPIISLFFYKVLKEKKFILLATIFLLENIAIILDNNINFISKYIYVIYFALILSKIIIVYMNQYKSKHFILKYIILSPLIIMFIYLDIIGLSYRLKSYDIVLNMIILELVFLGKIRKIQKENELNKNKLHNNKEYIVKTIFEIDEEINIQNNLKEEIKSVNYNFGSILEIINMPVIIINCDNECIMKNRYFDELLIENNYDPEDFNFSKFIKKEIEDNSEKIFEIINNNDYSQDNFIKIDLFNRKYKLALVRDYLSEEKIIVFEIKDITEISIKENELKKSEQRYKTLMDILCDGVIIHDGNTVNYINNIGIDIFEVDSPMKNVWTMDKLQKKVSKKSRDEFLHNIVIIEKGLKEREISKLELENGKIIDFISSSFILNDKKMILSIASDCTENERAVNKLEENKKTYSALIQTLPEGIMLINRYTRKQEYINKFMMRILREMGIDKFNQIIDSYIENGESSSFKTFNINAERSRRISIAIEQVPKQNNLLVVVRDLEVEQQIERVYESLQMIKERNKFKTEFLTRVASNLKKPINTIFEVNKILDSKSDIYNYSGMRSYTKTVKQNSYRLKRVLNNIEEISKIEAGVYDRDLKIYDLVKFLKEIVELCKDYTIQKGLDINFESNRKEILIYMDKDKMEKIILNILSNAMKFTERGGKILVSVNVNQKDVTIGVEDNGTGIPSNKLDFIFENFEQVNRSLSRIAEGTGVGLYLVKKLAFIHNAKIKVNSKIGCGSKFEVILEDNLIENNNENKKKMEDIIIDRECIDLEFSDIYLA